MTDTQKSLLKWWPVLVALAAGLAAFGNVKADVAVINSKLESHEVQQRDERKEANDALREIRDDIKKLLAHEGAK